MSGRNAGGRIARLKARLSDRDMAVLGTLFHLRLLRAEHIQRLHVADGSAATQARRTRSLLQRLYELKVVVRFARRIGGVRAGSSGFIYGLSGLGLAILETSGPFGGRRRTIWETKPAFQDHILAVAELYVELVEAHRAGKAELLSFDGEPACWRRFTGIGGAALTLKSDAYVRLGVGDFERHTFIEMDMGSERAPAVRRKLQAFGAYWRTGIEQQMSGIFPLVLWLVPDEDRRIKIAEVIHQMAHETQQLFAVMPLRDGVTWLTAPTGEGE
ncbi:replication-relaxation family protein [Actinomadura sp. 3N508]|uniref:replication-relaxation family protein n=1 Tax=Actinomadura sp. 3N508 TaxID=3375153 RepID=UPI00378EF542